jgi:ubiquitin carboxyl-terminal hydrolase 4/11/15
VFDVDKMITEESISANMTKDEISLNIAKIKPKVIDSIQKPLAEGDLWYLLDAHWYCQLLQYLGIDRSGRDIDSGGIISDYPGPIDNRGLFDKEAVCEENDEEPDAKSAVWQIREHMVEELDYNIIPHDTWNLLLSTFGSVPGSRPVEKRVVQFGVFVKTMKVEVYKIEVLLATNMQQENIVKRRFSRGDTVSKIDEEMREIFKISENDETRLWSKYNKAVYERITTMSAKIMEAGIYSGLTILVDIKNSDGKWNRNDQSSNPTIPTISNDVGSNNDNQEEQLVENIVKDIELTEWST